MYSVVPLSLDYRTVVLPSLDYRTVVPPGLDYRTVELLSLYYRTVVLPSLDYRTVDPARFMQQCSLERSMQWFYNNFNPRSSRAN